VVGTIELGASPGQIIRLNWIDEARLNTDWIELTLVDPGNPIGPDPVVTPGPYVNDSRQTPFNGAAIGVPGTIQAEHFDRGGAGVAWNDNPIFSGNADYRRDEGVDVGEAQDPYGRFVGWTRVDARVAQRHTDGHGRHPVHRWVAELGNRADGWILASGRPLHAAPHRD